MASPGSLFIVLCLAAAAAAGAVPGGRIVGGDPTTIEQYPSIVQVEFRGVLLPTWSQSCAGSILTSRWFLSAAHCFHGILYAPNLRRIRAGTTTRSSGGVIHNVVRAIVHPAYRVASSNDADIAVVELDVPLEFSSVVAAATIVAPGFFPPANLPVVHAGWGTTSSGGQPSSVLRDVTIYTVDHAICAQRYGSLWPFSYLVTDNMICAGILDVGGKDACQGDSGGPLFYQDILIGLVSWGIGCADAHFPGVSAAVSPFTEWIIENVN